MAGGDAVNGQSASREFPLLFVLSEFSQLQPLQSLRSTPHLVVSTTPSQWPASIIRKNAVFLTTIFAGAFAFELCVTSNRPTPFQIIQQLLTKLLHNSSFDTFSNKVWDSWNAGRQWKDIKPRYLVQAEEEDDD
ncbi:unnamed protein product [Penicillium pancosmium]